MEHQCEASRMALTLSYPPLQRSESSTSLPISKKTPLQPEYYVGECETLCMRILRSKKHKLRMIMI